MRVYIFTIILLIFTSPAIAAENIYICPMHPHITGEEGDNCPICGMSLVTKISNSSETMDEHTEHQTGVPVDAFKINPSYVQALGVRTTEVTHKTFGKKLRAFGEIVPSTRLEYSVNVRTKGWIVDLATDAVGDTVKKGDLLFTYYSPDLMTAQSDFLIGTRIGNAEQRLRLHGMDDKAVTLLKKKGKFLEKTPFHAPENGTVTMLNVRKGAHINEGGLILSLQDFSKVWVNVDIPLRDIEFLKVGTPAQVVMPETGEELETVIDYIHPISDPKNRTVMARLVLNNSDGSLKPSTYVDAIFTASSKSRLAVPVEAVLYSKMGAHVIENLGNGYFRPVMVKTGITSNGLTEIKSGLKHGQSIVTSGQFMLDAESNLRGGMDAMSHDHGDMTSDKSQQKTGTGHAH